MSIDVTVDDFRGFFPEFSNVSSETVFAYLSQAKFYVSPDEGCVLSGDKLIYAICLMAAHIMILAQAPGLTEAQLSMGARGLEISKSVGNVSVGKAPPPFQDSNLAYWLSLTPYGQKLLALLESMLVTPRISGGDFIRSGQFRSL